jgi:hypothetical protein
MCKKMVFLVLIFLFFNFPWLFSVTPTEIYISNGVIKLGINSNWGGGIGYFSREGADQFNLINQYDQGRNIQQAFWGDSLPASVYSQTGWVFNPTQGGDSWGFSSPASIIDDYGDSIYVKTLPIDWRPNQNLAPRATNSIMQQWVVLRDDVAQIIYRFKYNGAESHSLNSQEMPAPYFINYLETLAYVKNGSIQYKFKNEIPINNGEGGSNGSLTNDEYWAAYVNTSPDKWGCGVLTPGTNTLSYFRSEGAGGPNGFGTSYFAACRFYPLTPGFTVQYTAYLYIANAQDLRTKFNNIRQNGLQLAYNGSFESGSDANPSNWFIGTDNGGSHTYHTTGGEYVYDGTDSVALTAQSDGSTWVLPFWKQTQSCVTGDTTYKVKFRVRCEQLTAGTAGIRIIQFNRNGGLLDDSGIIAASAVSGTQSTFQYKTFNFTTKGTAATIEIRLQLNSKGPWSRVWFDKVEFSLKNP